MNNPVEKINNIKDMDDFLNFVVELARDANEHPKEWTNATLTDFLGQLASWVLNSYEGIENEIMTINCEMDPSGGWTQRKISIINGKTIY